MTWGKLSEDLELIRAAALPSAEGLAEWQCSDRRGQHSPRCPAALCSELFQISISRCQPGRAELLGDYEEVKGGQGLGVPVLQREALEE